MGRRRGEGVEEVEWETEDKQRGVEGQGGEGEEEGRRGVKGRGVGRDWKRRRKGGSSMVMKHTDLFSFRSSYIKQ